jgi:hypothetical protein
MEASALADLIFLGVGAGAFALFALLAVGLRRI